MGFLILIALITTILALDAVVRLVAVRVALPFFEARPLLGAELYPADPSAEQVTVHTPAGLALAASLLRTPAPHVRGLILFCHELGSNRWSAQAYCEGLLAAGFHVLAFDFRNHGDSQSQPGYQPVHWPTEFEVEDARAVLAWVQRRPDLRDFPLGLYGMSRGGAVALVVASESDHVRCVASDGAFACMECLTHYSLRWGRLYLSDRVLDWIPRWHFRGTMWLVRTASEWKKGYRYARVSAAVSKLRRKPVLMISGERDNYVLPSMTRNLYSRTGHGPAGLWIVPDAKHNMGRQVGPLEYDRRLTDFFSCLDSSTWDSASGNSLEDARHERLGVPLSVSSSGAPSV